MSDQKNVKPFQGFNWRKNYIRLNLPEQPLIMKPIQIHHKENGSIYDKPSFAFVLQANNHYVVTEISLEMLNDGLADCGYEVVRKSKIISINN